MIIDNMHGPVETFKYNDLPAIQVRGVMSAFSSLAEYVSAKPFQTIIELGTDYGGLTNSIADNNISKHATIHTFDINGSRFINYFPDKIKFHVLDIYSNFNVIEDLINNGGRTLLLCDGGIKALEFEKLSPKLKYNDMVMVHDYFPNEEEFKKFKEKNRWNWWEFSDSDYNINERDWFEPVTFFRDYAWFIRERI